jgi:hypothetical protein
MVFCAILVPGDVPTTKREKNRKMHRQSLFVLVFLRKIGIDYNINNLYIGEITIYEWELDDSWGFQSAVKQFPNNFDSPNILDFLTNLIITTIFR